MYKNKADYQAYQEKWRRAHPDYFKEYYQALKEGKKRKKISLFREVINLIKR